MLVYTWSINFNKSADNMVMFVHDLFLLGSWKLCTPTYIRMSMNSVTDIAKV